jgi:hypothetical protein
MGLVLVLVLVRLDIDIGVGVGSGISGTWFDSGIDGGSVDAAGWWLVVVAVVLGGGGGGISRDGRTDDNVQPLIPSSHLPIFPILPPDPNRPIYRATSHGPPIRHPAFFPLSFVCVLLILRNPNPSPIPTMTTSP